MNAMFTSATKTSVSKELTLHMAILYLCFCAFLHEAVFCASVTQTLIISWWWPPQELLLRQPNEMHSVFRFCWGCIYHCNHSTMGRQRLRLKKGTSWHSIGSLKARWTSNSRCWRMRYSFQRRGLRLKQISYGTGHKHDIEFKRNWMFWSLA